MTRALAVLSTLSLVVACGNTPPITGETPDANLLEAGHTLGPDATTDSSDGGGIDAGNNFDAEAPDTGYDFYPPAPGPIVYWGGPIITSIPHLYIIWYGDWSNNLTPTILEDMLTSFGGTPYSQILTGYYQTPQPADGGVADAAKTYATGQPALVKSISVSYTRGKNLMAGDVLGIVTDALKAGSLPADTDAIYYVLTSSDVTETMDDEGDTFCGTYCGYHDETTYEGNQIKYAFVGDPAQCYTNCTVLGALSSLPADGGLPPSPNNDWSADGMASVMVHEMCEATTDPLVSSDPAWFDQFQEQEIGDMCVWRFEPTYVTDAGARANVHWGDRDFLVQQMWVNGPDGGGCGLHP
jgi:hypothetical protein